MAEAEITYAKARALGREGRLAEALEMLSAAGETAEHAPSLALSGVLLAMSGRPADAVAAFDRSIALDPGQAVVHSDRGVALGALERRQEAIAAFDTALALSPSHLEALVSRSDQWRELLQGERALADADRALVVRPGFIPALRNRARALILLDRPDEALAAIETALAREPNAPESLIVRAQALEALGHFPLAHADLNTALTLQPSNAVIKVNRAALRLRSHDFAAGWTDYEARLNSSFLRRYVPLWPPGAPPRPLLSRAEVLGKRVLLVGEQGVGDQIMFASILPDLIQDAAAVTVIAEPRLLSLFAHSFPGVSWAGAPAGIHPGDYDVIAPIASLGRVYRQDRADFSGSPYLRPRPQVAAQWCEKLGGRTAPLRVGISWRGGLASTRATARSIPLRTLAPLLNRPDCEFISLQYGKAAPEVAAANAWLDRPIRLFPREDIENFEHLAGLVCALDVVVSVQTALIHLCGAIGAPCLAMIPFVTEWRYGEKGGSMPWYGSVSLNRQPERGAWGPVIAEIGAQLDERL